MSPVFQSRRGFFLQLAGSLGAAVLYGRPLLAHAPPRGDHPEPRPGIDASKVLKADEVPSDVVELYDAVRGIPEIVDGIRCHCGCADLEGFYSLLTCYEESGMATHCLVCQGEGRLVARMHADGRSLEEIRAAIDRRFG